MSPLFHQQGVDDDRVKSPYAANNKRWSIGALMGKAALCEWEPTPVHMEYEKQNYGYNLGTGAFGESGISIVEYDLDSADQDDNSRENIGSIVLAWANPSITA